MHSLGRRVDLGLRTARDRPELDHLHHPAGGPVEPNSAPLRAFSLLGAAHKWGDAGYLASSAAPPRRWRSSLETSECPRSCSSQAPKGGRMIVFQFDVGRVLKRPHWVPQLGRRKGTWGPVGSVCLESSLLETKPNPSPVPQVFQASL